MKIRRAESSDAVAIAPLLEQLGYTRTVDETRTRLVELGGSTVDAVFVAEHDARVAGVASVHLLPMFHAGGSIARLTALVVDEGARRTGAGLALVRAVEAFARAHGCERVELTSGDHRTGAHAFYEAIGYQRVSQRFIKPL